MKSFPAELSSEQRELLEETAQPEWIEPMLATLVHEYFDHPQWIYGRKLDGQSFYQNRFPTISPIG